MSCSSPTASPVAKKRRRPVDAKKNEELPFGTFRLGNKIYRNRLHEGEVFQDGHVAIQNLILPQCSSAVCTTFCADPDPAWLEQNVGEIPELLVIQHDNRLGESARCIGDAELVSFSSSSNNWHYLLTKPHTGGCLHGKLLLFRCSQGLRVVVCGSNLYRRQWLVDRDCLWVQDFGTTSQKTTTCRWDFEQRLRSFLDDMTACRKAADDRLVQAKLNALFDRIDMSNAAARLVISFPRSSDSGDRDRCGGYPQLADAVRHFHDVLDNGSDYSDDDDDGASPFDNSSDYHQKGKGIVYAMAGSFGDVDPAFLHQMHQAFQGEVRAVPSNFPWERVLGSVRCLWPSRETALTMNLMSLIGQNRPIPPSYWNQIPEVAKRHNFFDAPPNPPEVGLPQLGCHAVSHAKVMYSPGARVSVLYVGSHNFSKAAWGLRGGMPKNVEIGVVLGTTSSSLRQEWQDRLPCLLPSVSSTSPISYIPASPGQGAREAMENDQPEEAVEMAKKWLQREEPQKKSKAASRAVAKTPSHVIDLCDSD